jgi:hypothetical protein
VTNKLFYGDNLDVLREHIADESVDLIYLDPPFNSNANYNILFKSKTGDGSDAQIEAFEDTWHWNDKAEDAFDQVMRSGVTGASEMLRAMRGFLGENDMMAYLAMMAIRLIELHRVLKPTGSLYLHCDPTASHYLKLLLEGVFGPENYVNEVIWKRYGAHNDVGQGSRHYGRVHDTLLFYSKTRDRQWNQQFGPLDPALEAPRRAIPFSSGTGTLAHGATAKRLSSVCMMRASFTTQRRATLGRSCTSRTRKAFQFNRSGTTYRRLAAPCRNASATLPKSLWPCSNASSLPPPTKATSSSTPSAAAARRCMRRRNSGGSGSGSTSPISQFR